jgi:hypothetical protein
MNIMIRGLALATAGMLMNTTFLVDTAEARGCNCGTIRAYHSTTRDVVRDENEQVREQVRESIEEQTELLIEALKGSTREDSNHSQMQVEAATRVEDAAQINHTNRLKDEFRAEAESGKFDPNPFSCLLIDLFGGQGGGNAPAPGANGSGVTDQVAAWVAGNNAIVQAGGTGLSKHVADKKDEFAGYGGSANATTDWGLLLQEPTIDFSDPQMAEVAAIIIRNGLDSTPDRSISPAERNTPRGLDRIAKMEENSSRLQAAGESIEMALNMRTAVMQGAAVDTFREMAADSAYNRTITDKMSELQQVDVMTVWNYAPAGERMETLTNTGGMNERAWLFELHRIMSLNARINYMNLELANRDAIVNANILATLNDDD